MGALEKCEPKRLFAYFERICSIPHGSSNAGHIADYLVNFAKNHNLKYIRDNANNIIIKKPASKGYENAETIILQGHHDMVCVKEEGLDFDFETESIKPYVDGDFIRAHGTTLGGDNGIAIAMMLAILDDNEIKHPSLEMLMTADEEIGMIGAFALDCRNLKGHKLINLDSEYEGILMCSCAGGANVRSTIEVTREMAAGTKIVFELKGLQGGHSGVEINKGRANANVMAARILSEISDAFEYRLININGGLRETAIANHALVEILVEDAESPKIIDVINDIGIMLMKEYHAAEPDMCINAVDKGKARCEVVTDAGTRLITRTLLSLPDGVQAMSMDMPGLVQTSTNLGLLNLNRNKMVFSNTVRSSYTSQKKWIISKINAIVSAAGGFCEVDGDYPGWAFNPDSELSKTLIQAYRNLFGKEAKIDAVHAGIECGLFADAIEDLDCVSIGPTMGNVHTPQEYLSISSASRTFEWLKEILKLSI